MSTISNDTDFMLELVTENEAISEFKEATSATTNNPAVTWAKFVLTDDLPNKNKQRIPFEEFGNLIKSGIYMPIKMARGLIKDGHELSEPLGVITNLKKEKVKEKNIIMGLAALWSRERPEDIKFLKDSANEGRPLNLSWEILFKNSTKGEDGVEELHDIVLKASTVVGKPAYDDRTPILAIAAKGSPAYLDELGDGAFLLIGEERQFPFMDRSGTLDKELLASSIEDIKNSTLDEEVKQGLLDKADALLVVKVEQEEELQSSTEENKLDELELLKQELEKAKSDLDASKAELSAKEAALAEKEVELAGLREFKASVEAEANKVQKLQAIKDKFASAGITKEDAYFSEHEAKLLEMKDEDLDFMIQELVAFSSTEKTSSASIPAIVGNGGKTTNNIKELGEALRSLKK